MCKLCIIISKVHFVCTNHNVGATRTHYLLSTLILSILIKKNILLEMRFIKNHLKNDCPLIYQIKFYKLYLTSEYKQVYLT